MPHHCDRRWARWRKVLVLVQRETVMAWQRKRFHELWVRMSKLKLSGRTTSVEEVCRKMGTSDVIARCAWLLSRRERGMRLVTLSRQPTGGALPSNWMVIGWGMDASRRV